MKLAALCLLTLLATTTLSGQEEKKYTLALHEVGGVGTMNFRSNVRGGTVFDARQEFLYLHFETGKVHVEEVIGTQPMRKFSGKSEQ